jgi:hypothetical protein
MGTGAECRFPFTLFSSWSVAISFQHDVTVITLLGVTSTFMVHRLLLG